ncbi:MAG: DUF4010 domain-containing protein [Methylocystaceae bacterium]|jgi:uncharacterized membrane protein (DUF4010 family)|nr:DUF4010 domain-containing protein [Methylocystaceae bacterium]NBT96468.1 DUF4010 domain-containing protein [Methylocystaceae bacterium]
MYELSVEALIWRLSVAFAIGLLIGLERGWQARAEAEGERAAGLRTFALTALLGGVWGAIVLPFGDFAAVGLAIIFIGVCVVIAFFRLRQIEHDHTYGATTIVAIMLAFSLGVMAVIGHETPAVAAAVATTAMLASKNALHNWLQKLTWPELRSALALLVMSFILLPILPNHPVDRFGAINPFALWLMTVLIAVISFAGYVAVRVIGYERGLAVAGLAGGLASSTATTAAMARLAIKYPLQGKPLAGAAALANAIMAFRVLIILAVVNLTLALKLAAPLIVIGLIYGACGMLLTRDPIRDEHAAGESLIFENPLDIAAVLKFGALLSVVMIVSKLATSLAGNAGVLVVAFLSGLVDLDAIALAMGRHGQEEVGVGIAATAVLLALGANTIVKMIIGWGMGGREMGARFAVVSLFALTAGVVVLWTAPRFLG